MLKHRYRKVIERNNQIIDDLYDDGDLPSYGSWRDRLFKQPQYYGTDGAVSVYHCPVDEVDVSYRNITRSINKLAHVRDDILDDIAEQEERLLDVSKHMEDLITEKKYDQAMTMGSETARRQRNHRFYNPADYDYRFPAVTCQRRLNFDNLSDSDSESDTEDDDDDDDLNFNASRLAYLGDPEPYTGAGPLVVAHDGHLHTSRSPLTVPQPWRWYEVPGRYLSTLMCHNPFTRCLRAEAISALERSRVGNISMDLGW